MTITSFGDVSPRVGIYAYEKFLRHATPVTVLARFGQVIPVPKNKGLTVKARRFNPFPPLTAPLAEGVTPSVSGASITDVTGTLLQFGDVHGVTDVIEDTHEDPVLNQFVGLSGEQAGATYEQYLYGILKGGTGVSYANGTQPDHVNTPLTLDKQRAVIRALQASKASKITSILSGSTDIGTTPVEAAYVAVAHTDLGPDIRDLTGFTPVAQYGSMKPICEYEIGAVEDVRYILSPDLGPTANGGGAHGGVVLSTGGTYADIYPILFFGKDAFATAPLKNVGIGKDSNLVVEPTIVRAKPSSADPLGQRSYVGWKAYFCGMRLNEAWMHRLVVGASVL